MKFYQALARSLCELGHDTMFGLIGDANLYFADSFAREFSGRYVSAAHESGAVLMALGYAQVTGRTGVATVTHGPGVTNTISALVEGAKGRIPIVLICGDTAIVDRDNFQNVPQREHILVTGAGFEQLRSPATMAEDLASAFRRAELERRPIALNVPSDFNWQDVDYAPIRSLALAEPRTLVPASDSLDDAVGIVASARRPVVLAGRGAIDPVSRAALLRLAERIGAPVATTLKARGLFAGEAFDLGVMGTLSTDAATTAILAADCIVAFGAGLNKYTFAHDSFLTGKRLIQVDIDRAAVGRTQQLDAGLVGDCALTAERIIELLDMAEISPSAFRTEGLRSELARATIAPRLGGDTVPGTIDIREALLALDAILPADRVVVQDGGRFMVEAWKAVRAPNPSSYVHTVNSAAIGHGLGEAIGAAIASPGRLTVLIAGDGGFTLGGWPDFQTAVQQKLDLVVVICNDRGYGAEYVQFRRKDMDASLSLFEWADFAPVAVAMGGEGVIVRSASDLDRMALAIERRGKPLLIELKLDPESLSAITL